MAIPMFTPLSGLVIIESALSTWGSHGGGLIVTIVLEICVIRMSKAVFDTMICGSLIWIVS